MASERKYDVVTSVKLNEFVQDVNKRLKDGWKPLGGVSTVLLKDQATFCQAMVWKAAKPKTPKQTV
jgi:hypothetical protein